MPLSFFDFISYMSQRPILLLTVFLTLAVLLVNGWTDAPNAIAGVVASGTLSFRHAVWLAAVFNFLGVLCITSVNTSVAETIYSIAAFPSGGCAPLTALCAAMTAIILWATAAWYFGIPTSESHALVAGITGAAIALDHSLSTIRWETWKHILFGLVLSVFLGFTLSFLLSKPIHCVKLNDITIKLLQVLTSALSAFLHGAQDGQKFLAIFLLCGTLSQGQPASQTVFVPVWSMLLCAFFIASGTRIGGRKIINKVGYELVSLRPADGLSAEFGSILALSTATLLGLPVSTTHTRTAALLGAGLAGTGRADYCVARQILFAWILTFPGCMAISYWTARLFLRLL